MKNKVFLLLLIVWGQNTLGQCWSSFSAGENHTVAIMSNGTLWAWGININGMLGDGTMTNRNYPLQIGTANDWTAATAGEFHSGAIKANTDLYLWGDIMVARWATVQAATIPMCWFQPFGPVLPV